MRIKDKCHSYDERDTRSGSTPLSPASVLVPGMTSVLPSWHGLGLGRVPIPAPTATILVHSEGGGGTWDARQPVKCHYQGARPLANLSGGVTPSWCEECREVAILLLLFVVSRRFLAPRYIFYQCCADNSIFSCSVLLDAYRPTNTHSSPRPIRS